MTFQPSTIEDLDTIFEFYDLAVAYQKTKFHKHWQGFDLELIEKEIAEQRQWKILIDNKVACIFAITFEDEAIWKEKNKDKAIYFHRIVTHPDYRGQQFVTKIANWGLDFAKEKGLDYLRMDTWGDNESLINYYQKSGFTFLGVITPDYTGLPKHYEGITLSLFEIKNLKNAIKEADDLLISVETITDKIFIIRGQKVMLDRDLAELYGVETRVLNQAVKRNISRFPEDFMFEVSKDEFGNLTSQIVTSSWGGNRKLPFAFTEHGVMMLSSVLKSDKAIQTNIQIMRTFTKVKQLLFDNSEIKLDIVQIKRKLENHGKNIELVFSYLEELNEKKEIEKSRTKIGYKSN